MNYHPVTEKIKNLLKQNDFWFESFEHEEVKTSEEAAKVRPGYTLQQGAKALIVKAYNNGSDSKFVMFVIPANCKLDSKKAADVLKVKKMRFADSGEVDKITGGVLPGAIPPFGNLFGLNVYTDCELFNNEKIVFNAGDRRFSVAIKSEDYKILANPKIADLI
jgi:prolyl-tRNA editing enzyme YbaK/EbsC (Cys-tRNA(Pro) deacylase)